MVKSKKENTEEPGPVASLFLSMQQARGKGMLNTQELKLSAEEQGCLRLQLMGTLGAG